MRLSALNSPRVRILRRVSEKVASTPRKLSGNIGPRAQGTTTLRKTGTITTRVFPSFYFPTCNRSKRITSDYSYGRNNCSLNDEILPYVLYVSWSLKSVMPELGKKGNRGRWIANRKASSSARDIFPEYSQRADCIGLTSNAFATGQIISGTSVINEATLVRCSELRNDAKLPISGKREISVCMRRFYFHVTETPGHWCVHVGR